MKRFLSITFAIWCLTPAVIAQGTFLFQSHLNGGNVVPPVETLATAFGQFSLESQTLSYQISGDSPIYAVQATINGPASIGLNGSLIFDLGEPWLIIGPPEDPGGYVFFGTLTLTSQQISQLQSELWYVTVRDGVGAEIRGQILPVPEPSAFALAGIGTLMLLMRFRKRTG